MATAAPRILLVVTYCFIHASMPSALACSVALRPTGGGSLMRNSRCTISSLLAKSAAERGAPSAEAERSVDRGGGEGDGEAADRSLGGDHRLHRRKRHARLHRAAMIEHGIDIEAGGGGRRGGGGGERAGRPPR